MAQCPPPKYAPDEDQKNNNRFNPLLAEDYAVKFHASVFLSRLLAITLAAGQNGILDQGPIIFFRTLVIPDLKFKASLRAGLRTNYQPISPSSSFSSSSINLIFSRLSSAKISSFLVEFKLTKILSLLFH